MPAVAHPANLRSGQECNRNEEEANGRNGERYG
jgi:hypothetical protein